MGSLSASSQCLAGQVRVAPHFLGRVVGWPLLSCAHANPEAVAEGTWSSSEPGVTLHHHAHS